MSTSKGIGIHLNQIIIGYFHQNSEHHVPMDIIKLCIIYCFVAEEFDSKNKGKSIEITGPTNNIALSTQNDTYGTFFGMNVISFNSEIKYHHWRFKVISNKTDHEQKEESEIKINTDDEKQQKTVKSKLVIGIIKYENYQKVENNSFASFEVAYPYYAYLVKNGITRYAETENNIERWYGIGSHKYPTYNTIDMYLDIKTQQMSFNLNSGSFGVAFSNINNKIDYRMAITLSNKAYCVELISYNSSSEWDEKYENNFQCHLDYAHSIVDVKHKITHFEHAMKIFPNDYSYFNEYVEALLQDWKIEKAYKFIIGTARHRGGLRNIHKIADKMYYDNCYKKAEELFDLIDDMTLIEVNGTFEKARNYHNLKNYKLALKYFRMTLKHSTSNDEKSYCLSNMALLYDYENTSKPTEINNLDIAIERSEAALKYNPSQPSILNNLGYFYLVKKDYKKSYEFLSKSYELSPWNNLINGNMANLLYEMNRYDESIEYFERSLKNERDMAHPEVGPKCLENYANVMYIKQRFSKSVKLCYQLINRKEFKTCKYKHVIYWLMAQGYEKMSNYEQALIYVKKAKKLKPKNTLFLSKINKFQRLTR